MAGSRPDRVRIGTRGKPPRRDITLATVLQCFSLLLWKLWSLLALVRYLNPLRYVKLRQKPTYLLDRDGTVIYNPSMLERIKSFFRSDASNKKSLLLWAQDHTPSCKIKNLTTSWSDGIALCALMEGVCPQSCPRFDILRPSHKVNNCRLALKIVQKHLGIPQKIISPEEMSSGSKDNESKMCQLLSLIKWASLQKIQSQQHTFERVPLQEHVTNQNLPPKKPDDASSCKASGSGLKVGIVGKRSKFTISTTTLESIDFSIEIKGPSGEYCHEHITRLFPAQRSGKQDGTDDKTSNSHLVADAQGRTYIRQTSGYGPDGRIRPHVPKILFDYKSLGEGQFQISYIPPSVGIHNIFIKWKGQSITGSPYTVSVAESIEKLNIDCEGKTIPKKVLRSTKGFSEQTLLKNSFDKEGSGTSSSDTVFVEVPKYKGEMQRKSNDKGRARSLSKQATVTRRRVLKRIVTKGGQDVVTFEAPSSVSSCGSLVSSCSRDTSPVQSIDIKSAHDMMSGIERVAIEKVNTRQKQRPNSTEELACDMMDTIMKGVYKCYSKTNENQGMDSDNTEHGQLSLKRDDSNKNIASKSFDDLTSNRLNKHQSSIDTKVSSERDICNIGDIKYEHKPLSLESESEEGFRSSPIKIIQSGSLNKACFYMHQKQVESSGSSGSQQSEAGYDTITYEVGKRPLDPKDNADRKNGALKNQKKQLRMSCSMPTLSKSWKAFEIDPDDDSMSIEEMQAMSIAAQKKHKRYTLGSEDLQHQVQQLVLKGSLNRSETDTSSDQSKSMSLDENIGGIQITKDFLNATDTDGHSHNEKLGSPSSSRGSSRNSPQRSDFLNLPKLSEEDLDVENLDAKAGELTNDANEDTGSKFIGPECTKNVDGGNDTIDNGEVDGSKICSREPVEMNGSYPKAATEDVEIDYSASKRTPDALLQVEMKDVIPDKRTSEKFKKVKTKPTVDISTQVQPHEIKLATGWVTPNKYLRFRRKYSKRDAATVVKSENENHQQGKENDPNVANGNSYMAKGRPLENIMNTKQDDKLQQQVMKDPSLKEPLKSEVKSKSSQGNSMIRPLPQFVGQQLNNADRPQDNDRQAHHENNRLQPIRQSTTDSGIADDQTPSTSPRPTIEARPKLQPKPRFINGHRALTRRPYRGKINLDPRLISSEVVPEESMTKMSRAKTLIGLRRSSSRSSTGSESRMSRRNISSRDDSGSISESEAILLGPGRSHLKNRSGTFKRKVMFSKKIRFYRRSSSRSASKSSSRHSQDSDLTRDSSQGSLDVKGKPIDTLIYLSELYKDNHGEHSEHESMLESQFKATRARIESTESESNSVLYNPGEGSALSDLSEVKENSSESLDRGIIVCECAKYRDNVALYEPLSLRISVDSLCRDCGTLDLSRNERLSQRGDKVSSSSTMDSSLGSLDENYRGFGIPLADRNNLIGELGIFSALNENVEDEYLSNKERSQRSTYQQQQHSTLDKVHSVETTNSSDGFAWTDVSVSPLNTSFSCSSSLNMVSARSTCDAQNAEQSRNDHAHYSTPPKEGFDSISVPKPLPPPIGEKENHQKDWLTPLGEDYISFTGLLGGFTLKSLDSFQEHFGRSISDDFDWEGCQSGREMKDEVPEPEGCFAVGPGLQYGLVTCKNNFQVETKNAGNGALTVGIQGPRPHTVQDLSITYTGDDLYEVIYEVTDPGYYIINIKWSELPIPDSPFICKVTY